MAPPKASLVHQQPASPQPVAGNADAAKGGKTARRRKTKQQQSTQQQQQQQEHLSKSQKTNGHQPRDAAVPLQTESATADGGAPRRGEPALPLLASSERTLMKPQVVAASGPVNEEKPQRAVPARAVPVTAESGRLVVSKQQSTDEADEIDAGIELDGSSNSGSSVKDIADDQQQLKSNSVSPVMAQSSLVVEIASNETTNYETAEMAKPQLQAATGGKPNSGALLCAALGPAKKVSTKQQLAANQQVIDADEQLLQAKLQSKQRKCSLDTLAITEEPTASSIEHAAATTTTNPATAIDTKQAPVPLGRTNVKSAASGAPLKRRFSSQGSQEGSSDCNPSAACPVASLCKICNQHVYQMERMMAEKFVYHKRCFRCHQCKQQLLVGSYSSHEGLVYCKLHHRQLFQPQVKLDNEDDVDIVAKSRIRKRQMIICENEPAELPKDVVRSDTKVDDGIDLLNLNLNNILEKFERGTVEGSQPSTASSTIIEKPSFNIKKTLMAFERQTSLRGDENEDSIDSNSVKNNGVTSTRVERPVVGKLTSLNGFLNRQNSQDGGQEISLVPSQQKPFSVKRSESLMMRLKKYESRIAGEQVDDDEDDDENADAGKGGAEKDENNNSSKLDNKGGCRRNIIKTEVLPSVDLSSLKNQWESRDISKVNREDEFAALRNNDLETCRLRSIIATRGVDESVTNETNHPSSTEKDEELLRVRQELAQRKLGDSAASVRNIYENAIREAELQQKQQQASARRDLTHLEALNGISASNIIQKQFLRQSSQSDETVDGDKSHSSTYSSSTNGVSSPPVKGGRFQLNLSNRANKLKERFELGLIKNSSQDDSDLSDQEEPEMSRLEQIKREKLEDLSVFTEGEIKAREARSLFQQIDRRISQENSNGVGGSSSPRESLVVGSKSLASISASMQAKLTNQMNNNNSGDNKREDNMKQQPIRLTNNVRT